MKILVVGGGGREHALCWKLAQSPLCDIVYVAPGNHGIGMSKGIETLPIAAHENERLLAAAKQLEIDLTVIGPDDVLAAGLTDLFEANGLAVFGPTRRAAQLEWSKDFSKAFMARHNIPQASWFSCQTDAEIEVALAASTYPLVIKVSGLALGKGVIIVADENEAREAIVTLRSLGAAADTLIIEEFLVGREITLMCFSDGHKLVPMLPSEDHKQIYDDDRGPNTGGMGAIVPPPWVDEELMLQIRKDIIDPTERGLDIERLDFRGILYLGLMITADGPKLLEYNARFGDPETQAVLPMLKSDLVEIMLGCCRGDLNPSSIKWREGSAACVVLASPGYPASSTKNLVIEGLDRLMPNVQAFYAGIGRNDKAELVTNGGRVLALCARAETLEQALGLVYRSVDTVSFPGKQFRSDIGRRLSSPRVKRDTE